VTAQRQHRALVLAVILVGYLLVLIDASILMVALPRIHRDLGFSAVLLALALLVTLITCPRRRRAGSADAALAPLRPAAQHPAHPGGAALADPCATT